MSVPDFPPGRVLAGKYTLTAPLGRTPWAATYRAALGPGQEVAIKVLDTALADQPLLLDGIVRAGSAAAALPQPPALAVLEHGKDPETGALFIVRRLSSFPSLAFHLERGPLPPEVAIAVVRALAQALDTLHAAGQKHLALKPTNLFVGPSPAYTIEIADFGANAVRALVPDEVRQGFSAPWLAPEQIANDSMATASSDVFALALVAFAALTGKSFWRSCGGPTPDLPGWRAEVIAPPGRASQRGAEIGVPLHPAFDNVFGRALSVPRDRFATAGELARALSEALDVSRGDAAYRTPVSPDRGQAQGLPYAATLPRPEGGAFGGPSGGTGGLAPSPAAMGAPAPVQAVAAPTPSLGPPMSVAGVPKKGGKGWLIVVAAVVFLGLGVGFYFVQRARAAQALASAEAAAASASASAAAASASAAVALAAPASASAVEAPASAAAAAPDSPGSADAGAAAAPPPSSNAAAPEPSPQPAPQAPATASPEPPSQTTASRPPPSNHTTPPAVTGVPGPAAAAPTSTSGAAGGHKKPCGKFLERCPDSGS